MARPQADDLPVVLVVDDQREKFDRLVAAASRFADGRLLRQFRFEFTGCFEELKEWYRRHRGTFVSLIVQDIDFATTEERKLVGFLGGVRPAGTVIDIRALQGLLIYSHLRHLGIDRVVPVLFTVGSAGHTQVQELTQFIMYPGFGSCSFIEEGAVDSAAGLEALLAAVDVHALRPLDSQQRGHWRNYHHMVIGRSRKMARLTHEIERIGPTDGIVLILGGPGVGKELVANALHRTSYRFSATDPGRQFPLTVNMGALDRNLVWDDLFGHESGAYTGATGERAGIFEAARGSTVFLDEIGEIDHELQVKLLRIIEYHRVKRLGSSAETDVDIRIIASTNKTIEELQTNYRRDFYTRLVQQCLPVPSLKERWEEESAGTVELDVQEFFDFVIAEMNRNPRHRRQLRSDPTAVRFLTQLVLQYIEGSNSIFDGNMRTLRHIIERAYERAQYDGASVVGMGQVASTLTQFQAITPPGRTSPHIISIEKAVGTLNLNDLERQAIIEALAKTNNHSKAAALLGIHRDTLRRKIEEYKIC